MSDQTFGDVLEWLRAERAYQQQKFDYATEGERPAEYWLQQFASYEQRLPLFGLDTPQGAQAALKLAATAVALAEHVLENVPTPKPGLPSGTIEPWQRVSAAEAAQALTDLAKAGFEGDCKG